MASSQMDKLIAKRNNRALELAQSAEEPRHFPALLLGFALLLAVVSYWPALEYGFVFDDIQQIVKNPALTSWNYLPQYFTANVWAGVFPGINGNYYRPLFLLWLRINYLLFKLAPWGWHLTSLLAHLAAVWIFFLLVMQWTGDGVVAGWAALLFAVHPIHIEAVAWVSAVPEVLFTLAGLGAIYSYLRRRQNPRPALLLVAAPALYGIALFTKETAIVFWPMIVACDWWVERDRPPESRSAALLATAKRQLPFAVFTALYVGMRLHALRGFAGGETTHTFGEVLSAAPSLAWFYLRKLVFPSGLSPIYFAPETGSFTSPHFYLPLLAVCALCAGLVVWGRKSKAAAFPGFLLALSLVPPLLGVSVFLRHDLAHNRYLYLPSAAACMLFAMALRAVTRLEKPSAATNTRWLAQGTVAAVALVLVCAVRAQEWPYRDNVALFTRAVQISPDSVMAWGYLGEALMTAGRYPDGIAAFHRAEALEPESQINNYRLGAAYYLVQDMPSAEVFFQRTVDNYRQQEVVTYDYVLYRLGLSQYAQGKMPLAEATFRRSVELEPNAVGYHLALAAALKRQGKLREAREQLELELKRGPDPEASKMLSEVDAGLKATASR
jgi:tetratricopeptide (TPR) repeat protein